MTRILINNIYDALSQSDDDGYIDKDNYLYFMENGKVFRCSKPPKWVKHMMSRGIMIKLGAWGREEPPL